MIYLLCVLVGITAGGAAVYILRLRADRVAAIPESLNGVRWERGHSRVTNDAIRHLRRHYPTHDLITNAPFLDLVTTKGARAEAVARRCHAWTVAVVMIDKRTGDSGRLIIWSDDSEMEEKTWILRRVGYKVIVVDRNGGEQQLIDAMAA